MDRIFAHLIGDFLLQNDWMTKGKKQKSWICAVHVLCYMIPFIFTGLSPLAVGLIAGEHFIQDRTGFVKWSMVKIGQTAFVQPPHAPWSIILIDQIYHILFIASVANI